MITNNMRLEALELLVEAVSAATEAARDLGISYPELTALEELGVETEELLLPRHDCLATIQFTFGVDYVEEHAKELGLDLYQALTNLAIVEFIDAVQTELKPCIELTWSSK